MALLYYLGKSIFRRLKAITSAYALLYSSCKNFKTESPTYALFFQNSGAVNSLAIIKIPFLAILVNF